MAKPWVLWLLVGLGIAGIGEGLAQLLLAQELATPGSVVQLLTRVLMGAWGVFGVWHWREVPWVAGLTRVWLASIAGGLMWTLLTVMGVPRAATAVLWIYIMLLAFWGGLVVVRLVLQSLGKPVFWPLAGVLVVLVLVTSWGIYQTMRGGTGFRIWELLQLGIGVPAALAMAVGLAWGWTRPGVSAVAKTLVDEAVRMKLATGFVLTLFIMLPVLQLFAFDPNERVSYRIQSFLTWSLMITGTVLGFMTLFLSARTVTAEREGHQVFLSLTKPLPRSQYLLGKWLGLVMLNGLLVVVAGTGIYLFTKQIEEQAEYQGVYDELATQQQVLTARIGVLPIQDQVSALFDERLAELQTSQPGVYDEPTPEQIQAIQSQVEREFFNLGGYRVAGTEDFGQRYVFNLEQDGAWMDAEAIQLQIKPRAAGETEGGRVRLLVQAGGDVVPPPTFDPELRYTLDEQQFIQNLTWALSDNTYHVIDIPQRFVGEDGVLEVDIVNYTATGTSVSFHAEEGMTVYFQVDSFGPNFVRTLILLWFRLGFVAMVGLAAGSVLSFPVASLLALLVYFAAVGSSYIGDSLDNYSILNTEQSNILVFFWEGWPRVWNAAMEGNWEDVIKSLLLVIGKVFTWLMPNFSHATGTALLAEGRLVSWSRVQTSAVLVLGISTTAAYLLGWYFFGRRELARVVV